MVVDAGVFGKEICDQLGIDAGKVSGLTIAIHPGEPVTVLIEFLPDANSLKLVSEQLTQRLEHVVVTIADTRPHGGRERVHDVTL